MDWDYHEIRLKGKLSDLIDCIWWENYSDFHPNNNQHLLIPDNSIELIFTDTPIERFFQLSEKFKSRKSQLAGLRTAPQICKVIKSPVIGVRFRPKTFYRLCKTELSQTINDCLNPIECFGQSVVNLEKEIFKAANQQKRTDLIQSYFEGFLPSESNPIDELFEKMVEHIEKSKGDCSIRELPILFNTSASTIERKFKKNLGITPKKYGMLVRFVNQVLAKREKLNSFNSNSGFNYFDQAHFIKEVSKFSGLTPKQLASFKIGIQEVYSKK